jgi:hypothetical protein
MGINFNITFCDAEGNQIGAAVLERRFTHYEDDVYTFWHTICYTEKPKKEFVDIFMEKINACNINSRSYQLLVSAFGHIISHDEWCEAVMIHTSCQ